RIARLDQATAERTGVTPQEARAESVKSIPVGRIGATEEFGATAAFLASPLAAYVTGSLIRLDGGAVRAI
ncbi:MAG: 3-oxoacyl-ACP reductase, partial [Brevundimonas sp. 32-68-21]